MPRRTGLVFLLGLGLALPTGGRAQEPLRDTSIVRPPARLSAGRRVGATLASTYVGFGVGHRILGYDKQAHVFAKTQLIGAGAFFGSVALLPAIGIDGTPVAYGGAGLFVGSKIVEVIDVIVRPIMQRQPAVAPSTSRAVLTPVVLQRHAGLAVRYRF